MYNEIEREFNMEVKQRKNIGYGAYHKKGGSKSKKCSLPSDNLTPAQKRKLNGPVETYAINQPMCWEAFKGMPTDLQQDHLNYIQNRFAAGISSVSKYVFGLAGETLKLHAARHGLVYKKYDRGHRGDIKGLSLWAEGLCEVSAPATTNPVEPAEVAKPVALAKPEPDAVKPLAEETVKSPSLADLPDLFLGGKLLLSGKAEEVIPRLLTLIGRNDAWLSVHLSFTNRKDD